MEYPNAIRPPDNNPDIDEEIEEKTDIAVAIVETVTPIEPVGNKEEEIRESRPHQVGNIFTTRNHSIA